MSVLRCPICEENRMSISMAIQQVNDILGTKAQGKQPILASLICNKCHSKEKSFSLMPYDAVEQDLEAGIYVDSLDDGKYLVRLDLPEDSLFDKLTIINAAKDYLDNLNDYDIDEVGNVKIGLTSLACQCGHTYFEMENI